MGQLQYPHGAGQVSYSHNKRCVWVLRTTPGKVMNISFQNFHLEASTPCVFDWVEVSRE